MFNVEKCCDLETGVKGHSRSLKAVPFGRSCMDSYYCSLVTLSIFDLRYSTCVVVRTKSHTGSKFSKIFLSSCIQDGLKVVPFYRLGVVSYQCSIETLPVKRTVFEIFDFKNDVSLKTGLGVRRGHWKYRHPIERERV